MSGHQSQGSDTGAAFLGLIGGALFIGAILYSIVLLTNNRFKHEGGGEGKPVATADAEPAFG